VKLWLWRYRFNGIEKNMTFGEFPVVGPENARDLHFSAKKLLATGINPMAERRAEAEAKQQEVKAVQREADSSFENIARKWWEWSSVGKSPRHADTVMRRLEADVFPAFGHKFIDAVTSADVRELMLAIERRDARDVAKRAHENTSQIFRFALARDIAVGILPLTSNRGTFWPPEPKTELVSMRANYLNYSRRWTTTTATRSLALP